jgi:protein-S-isoprenylcysteine O-methyltransferase Ste14
LNWTEASGRARLPLAFVLAGVYAVFARPNPALLPYGMALAALGLFIRAWAAGHIEKNRTLATGGPYAYVRNPLYLGSFLLAVGFALVWNWAFMLLVIAFFVVVYIPTVRRERDVVAAAFPAEYPGYEANVPLVVPRLTPWRGSGGTEGEGGGFDLRLYLRHSEWKAALGFAAGLTWLLVRLRTGF